jgi:hypothetical protein
LGVLTFSEEVGIFLDTTQADPRDVKKPFGCSDREHFEFINEAELEGDFAFKWCFFAR